MTSGHERPGHERPGHERPGHERPGHERPQLTVVVGAGGVGKTTLAAALGVAAAARGERTLVMTFDPSLRLKDALGVTAVAREAEVQVKAAGQLFASLLDARQTFDRLITQYAPDPAARERILSNRYYDHLAGHLGGILEYMAVERLYEVATAGSYDRVILDTPPTRQAIDFLEAPSRIVDFLDSGALKIALRPWFDADGDLRLTSGWGLLGRGLESFLDKIVGLQLLRDMSEFFRAFGPLFPGFKARAEEVRELLAGVNTTFLSVAGPGRERIPETLFFIRRLREAGFRLGPLLVNRVHPEFEPAADAVLAEDEGHRLLRWLGAHHRLGLAELTELKPPALPLIAVPLAGEPTDLAALAQLGESLLQHFAAAGLSWEALAAW